MKILIIVNEFPPDVIAGTAMSTLYLSKHLAAVGHDVHVAVTVRGRHRPRVERIGNTTVHRLEPPLRLKGTRWLQRLIGLFRLAAALEPDLIHGQALSCGAMAALIGRILKRPSVTSIQGMDLYHAGALARGTELMTALNGSTAVLAVTEDLKARAAALSGRRDIVVLPHGLELDDGLDSAVERLRRETAAWRRHPLLLYAGQLHERKGVLELVDAMKRIHAAQPEAVLAILGAGPLEERLQEKVRREDLDSAVRFLGVRSHRTVLAFMRLADVFVLPSREEAFGIVLIEAMSQGLPVVASDVQNIRLLIRPGVNGLLVPARDAGGLAESILRMIADPAAAAIGRRNRKEALPFAWDRLVGRYDRVYAALQRPPSARA